MTSFRDVELLSAYLDGQLSLPDSARLKSRLSSDANLRAAMDDVRAARGLLRQLPQRRAPRNFTLTPKMAGIKPPEPRAYPTLRIAAALATLLFIATFAINGLAPAATSSFAAAPAPALGMGGGGAESVQGQAPVATEAPMRPFAAMSPTEVTPSADQAIAPTGPPSTKSVVPALSNGAPPQVRNEAPVPIVWQIGLATIAILFGAAAWLIRRASENKFRKQWK